MIRALIILTTAISLFGQQSELWMKTYGGQFLDAGFCAIETIDGGFAIVGSTQETEGQNDIWLIKTDGHGDTLWTQTYSNHHTDEGQSIIQLSDAGYLISARTYTNSYVSWLIRTNSVGDTLWTKMYEGNAGYRSRSIAGTSDGGFVITGEIYNNSNNNLWLMKIDANGDALWTRSYGGEGHDIGQAVVELQDGGFLVAGKIDTRAPTYTYDDIWIIRTDSLGDTLWTQTIGGTGADEAISMIENLSGSFTIICQSDWSTNLFINIDINGDIINSSELEYSNDGYGSVYDISLTEDNGYILVGSKYFENDNNSDVWISKFNSDFEFVWEYSANVNYYDKGNSIRSTSDGGFIIAGVAGSEPSVWPETDDLVLMRISSIESPKGLVATQYNSQTILQWDPYTNAQKYYIFRDTTEPAISLIDSVLGPDPVINFTDSNTSAAITYHYRIKAITTQDVESGFSKEATIMLRDTLFVPADYSSIQLALNGAVATNVIMVSPGTYYENIIWPNLSGIQLLTEGNTENTIIDGGGQGSVIFMNHEYGIIDSTTRISGFHITNGAVTNGAGVILVSWENPILENLLFTENHASNNGGGLFIGGDCAPIMRNCVIDNNTAAKGAGLYLENSFGSIFEALTIINNSATSEGGGLWIDGNLSISNSNLSDNSAGSNGGGALFEGTISLSNVSILNNTTSQNGGGFYLYGGNVTALDCIVSGNEALSQGGGIYLRNCRPILENLKVIDNQASQGGGIYFSSGGNFQFDLIHSDIVRNTATEGAGLYIHGNTGICTVSDVIITDNIAIGDGGGIHSGWGLQLLDSQIHGNISNGKGGGAYFVYGNPTCQNVSLSNNEAYLNGGAIYIDRGSPSISNASISNNHSQDGYSGIYAREATPTIVLSNIAYNNFGLYNYTNTNTVSAINNWWGSQNGPYHPNQNASGTGDSTNQFVNVTPWQTLPVVDCPLIPPSNLSLSSVGNDYISLVWNQSPESAITGYKVHTDIDSSGYPYDNSIEVGLDTAYTLLNVVPGEVYFISVSSFDENGSESWYSQEVQATPQPAPIIGINPPALDFSTLLVGEARSMELTIINSGTDILAVSDILHSTENIAVSANTFEIPLGEDITITIQLTPSYYGLSGDTLVIQNNSFNNPSLQVPIQWFGDLPENPIILAVNDIPADQGGQVRVSFAGSKYDGYDGSQEITSYSVWRHLEGETWDAIGMFNAVQDSIYHFVAPTLCDSTGEGNCWSSYRVSAHTATAGVYFYSDSLGGYSVDNIAPAIPDGLLALATGERVQLQWNSNPDSDFQYFAIYRSLQSDFDPDTMNTYLYTTIDTVFEDAEFEDDGTYYYRVSAFDYSGNESGYSTQASAVIVGIDEETQLPQEFVLRQNYPNPFNPTTTIRYGLPEDSNVSLVIYDVRGQVVQTLDSEHKSAGWYDVVWNGQTADGKTISTGIYFARLVAGEYSQVVKMLYLK